VSAPLSLIEAHFGAASYFHQLKSRPIVTPIVTPSLILRRRLLVENNGISDWLDGNGDYLFLSAFHS
jgi:hypothetical protein